MKKHVIALALLLALLLCVVAPVHAEGELFFVGINDALPQHYFSGSEAPYYSGGYLYVPCAAFDHESIGIVFSYDLTDLTVSLRSQTKSLTYNVSENTVTDEQGRVSDSEVKIKNGVPYVPGKFAASHFGFTICMLESLGCTILRFTDGSQTLDDETFERRIEGAVSYSLKNLDVMMEELQDPEMEHPEEPQEEGPGALGPATVYVAFADRAVSQETLGHLKALNTYATFFVTQSQIRENPDLIRRIYSSGHQIGLTVDENTVDMDETLRSANDALDALLFFRSVMVLLPSGTNVEPCYRVFSETDWTQTEEEVEMTPVEIVLSEPDLHQLLVCRDDAYSMLEALYLGGASMPQLLETTQLDDRMSLIVE